jgi:hypothetical protein
MSKQKRPNITPSTTAEFGVLTNARLAESGKYETQFIAPNSNGFLGKNKTEKGLSSVFTLTSAQILALNATPVEVLPACGAGYAYQVTRVTARHAAGTAYTAGAGEDITLKLTNASGAQVITAFDSDGFIDAATAQIRSSLGIAGTPIENAAIVAHLLVGEITGGNFDVELLIEYDIIPTDFAA